MTAILEPTVASQLGEASPLVRLFALFDQNTADEPPEDEYRKDEYLEGEFTEEEYPEEEQRIDAQMAAAHHAYNVYAGAIGRVLEDLDWAGHPSLKDNRLPASAVARLGDGLWLHHTLTITEDDGVLDVLTLVAPCSCGRGYLDIQLAGEGDLVQILTDLRCNGGRAVHQHADDCASVPDPHAPTTK
ncbi:hypothetical protein [Streptomyces sp. Tue6028]|uniref:hypothetical protein n=1 Tax=Streptomyces sp. Tue6028 TaxID=2036037 RepID=UPI003D7346EA